MPAARTPARHFQPLAIGAPQFYRAPPVRLERMIHFVRPHNPVAFARRILEAMPDGTGAVMIEGKMQNDATWKQAKVIVDLARLVAAKDPGFAAGYGL